MCSLITEIGNCDRYLKENRKSEGHIGKKHNELRDLSEAEIVKNV